MKSWVDSEGWLCFACNNTYHMGHTLLFQPTLRSQVTRPSEVKSLSFCHRSHCLPKTVTHNFQDFLSQNSSQNGSSKNTICLVTPSDGGWRVAHLFMVVTGHKPQRVGWNSTVWDMGIHQDPFFDGISAVMVTIQSGNCSTYMIWDLSWESRDIVERPLSHN